MAPKDQIYRVVAVGGTFDILHKGHEEFLTKAFSLGEKIIIGVTGDRLVQNLRKSHPVRPYTARVNAIRRFLAKRGWTRRAILFMLSDPYGPAGSRKNLEAIIVTRNTLASAKKLNKIRKQKGLSTLEIRVVRLASAQDGKPISSTRIRRGEIDREGRLLGASLGVAFGTVNLEHAL